MIYIDTQADVIVLSIIKLSNIDWLYVYQGKGWITCTYRLY